MAVHQLLSTTWPTFAGLAADRVVAVLPLGALEAHGPHLPLGTDIVIAEAMAREGARRLSERGLEVVVLPALPVAPAPFAAGFAGTIDTPQLATTALITGVARSLHRHGVRMMAVANAHHDPSHVESVRAAVAEVNATGDATLVFPDLTRRRWASRLTEEFQSGACHAGRYEGSIILAETPMWVDTGRLRELPPNPASLVDAIRRGDRSFVDAGGPQAYFGWPADATADEGRRIIASLGAILEDAVVEALEPVDALSEGEGGKERMIDTHNDQGTVDPSIILVEPTSRPKPRGFSHGLIAPAGWRILYVAGQTASNDGATAVPPSSDQTPVAPQDFVTQFEAALANVLDVVRSAGGEPEHVVRLTIYVTDLEVYRKSRPALGEIWKRHMGTHYPAMALLGVAGLVETNAVVEMEADAVLPPSGRSR